MTEAVRIISKFSGKCQACPEQILVGDLIVWVRGVGAWHDQCYNQTTIPQPVRQVVHDRTARGPSPRRVIEQRRQEQIHTGVCDLCTGDNLLILPVVVGPSRITRWLCETCIEQVTAYARKAP